MSPQIPVRLIRQVRQRAGDVCEYCCLPQASQEATFHVDHVLPRSQQGPTELGKPSFGLRYVFASQVSPNIRR